MEERSFDDLFVMDRALSPHPPGILGSEEDSPYRAELPVEADDEPNTISVTFTVDDRVGMLKDVLEIFASRNISLSLLESRPGAAPGTYDFFVQFSEINATVVTEVTSALDKLPTCTHVVVLNAKEGNDYSHLFLHSSLIIIQAKSLGFLRRFRIWTNLPTRPSLMVKNLMQIIQDLMILSTEREDKKLLR